MATGDLMCTLCGSFLPNHAPNCTITATNTSINPFGIERLVPRSILPGTRPYDQGQKMDKKDLVELLTGYLGDEVFARRFADCMTMIRQKNADYTQGVAKRDRIAAFRRIGGDINVPMTKVWAIFAQKHWGAVMKFVKDGQVESEPIDGRINDLINYFVLLGAIVHDGEGGNDA